VPSGPCSPVRSARKTPQLSKEWHSRGGALCGRRPKLGDRLDLLADISRFRDRQWENFRLGAWSCFTDTELNRTLREFKPCPMLKRPVRHPAWPRVSSGSGSLTHVWFSAGCASSPFVGADHICGVRGYRWAVKKLGLRSNGDCASFCPLRWAGDPRVDHDVRLGEGSPDTTRSGV